MNCLQLFQTFLARAVVKAPKSCHVAPVLKSFLWVKTNERIDYTLLFLKEYLKEYSSDWPYWLSAVVTTRRLRISLTSSIGLTRRNHGIDYGPVPVHV